MSGHLIASQLARLWNSLFTSVGKTSSIFMPYWGELTAFTCKPMRAMPAWNKLDLTFLKPQPAHRLSQWCAVSRFQLLGLPTMDKKSLTSHPWSVLAQCPTLIAPFSRDTYPSSFGPWYWLSTWTWSPTSLFCQQNPDPDPQWHCAWGNLSSLRCPPSSLHTAYLSRLSIWPYWFWEQPPFIMTQTLHLFICPGFDPLSINWNSTLAHLHLVYFWIWSKNPPRLESSFPQSWFNYRLKTPKQHLKESAVHAGIFLYQMTFFAILLTSTDFTTHFTSVISFFWLSCCVDGFKATT